MYVGKYLEYMLLKYISQMMVYVRMKIYELYEIQFFEKW